MNFLHNFGKIRVKFFLVVNKDKSKKNSQDKVEETSFTVYRVLIIGVSSYLGSALAISLRDEYEVFGSYFKHPCRIEGVHCFPLDILNGSDILDTTKKFSPNIIIYCAGMHNRESCDAEKSLADVANFKAPTIFLKLLPSNIHFLYFSVDEIFGQPQLPAGKKAFSESDTGLPINVYAKTKFNGENLVFNHTRLTTVFRLGTLYGETHGSPFHQRDTLLKDLDSHLKQGKEISLGKKQMKLKL
jgi:dTDP-4-dehydrorhamnose reductase